MYVAIQLPIAVSDGKELEVRVLLDDPSRKLVLIQLRRGAILDEHTARVPITIHAVAGNGVLRVAGEALAMSPGTLVPVDPHAVHSVSGEPDLAILVTFFRRPDSTDAETTARFE